MDVYKRYRVCKHPRAKGVPPLKPRLPAAKAASSRQGRDAAKTYIAMNTNTTNLGKIVSFRLSSEDHAAYMAKVTASGMSPSQYFRQCILNDSTEIIIDGVPITEDEVKRIYDIRSQANQAKKKKKEATSEAKSRLLYLVNKSSNNINQLARAANTAHLNGTASELLYENILHTLTHISNHMKAVIQNVD